MEVFVCEFYNIDLDWVSGCNRGIYDNKNCAIVEKHRAEEQPTLALHISMSICMKMIGLPYGGMVLSRKKKEKLKV